MTSLDKTQALYTQVTLSLMDLPLPFIYAFICSCLGVKNLENTDS
jgi:hypothetical protein